MQVMAMFINMERRLLTIQNAVTIGVKVLSSLNIKEQLCLGFYGIPSMITELHIKNSLSYLMIIALVYL